MRQTLKKKANFGFLTFVLWFFLSTFHMGCTSSVDIDFKRGTTQEAKGNYKEAIEYYRKVISRGENSSLAIKAAQKAAKASYFNLKDFKSALIYYKHIVVNSQVQSEQIAAQRYIAEIVFNHISDYKQAITEYTRLLALPHTEEEGRKYKFAIAKSYFFVSNFFQAEVEVDSLIDKKNPTNPKNYEPMVLKANILLTTKQVNKAIDLFLGILKHFPQISKKDRITLNLAVSYEETKQFDKAIELLEEEIEESYQSVKAELELKIDRKDISNEKNYGPLLTLSNINFLSGKNDEAVSVLQVLINYFSDRAKQDSLETISNTLAKGKNLKPIRYSQFAIDESKTDYIYYLSERIYQLKRRKALQPGARGLKK